MIKLWIDDLRPPPDASWAWALSSEAAIQMILTGDVTDVSFDHDLGGDDTAMPAARLIEELAHDGKLAPLTWHVHSANPVGRANLTACMLSAERFWVRAAARPSLR